MLTFEWSMVVIFLAGCGTSLVVWNNRMRTYSVPSRGAGIQEVPERGATRHHRRPKQNLTEHSTEVQPKKTRIVLQTLVLERRLAFCGG